MATAPDPIQRDLNRLLDQAREEGRAAGRSEGALKLTQGEQGAALLGSMAEALEAMGHKTAGSARAAFGEAAAILRDSAKQVQREVKTLRDGPKPKEKRKRG